MRIVVVGAIGQLGTDLISALQGRGWELVPLTRKELDVRDPSRTREVLSAARPDVVINTSAFTRVDDCEDHPELAFQVNALGTRNVARVCAELGCTLVYISTDYVFGGEKRSPYAEDDLPSPLSVYGISKLAGEHFVRALCARHFIVRTSGLYGAAGSSGKGGNFVETMVRLAGEGRPIRVVNDQVLTPTYTRDLAQKIVELLLTGAYGVYHITNAGQCSWYEFAAQIFELLRLEPDFGPTTTAAYGAKARRPAYSVLSNGKLKQLNLTPLRPWPEALEAYLHEKGYLAF